MELLGLELEEAAAGEEAASALCGPLVAWFSSGGVG